MPHGKGTYGNKVGRPPKSVKKGKMKKYGGGGNIDPGQQQQSPGEASSRFYPEDIKKKRRNVERFKYGGSVSYNSSSVRGYSKTYGGMGGEDE
jgi:hypothetical protein